MTAPAPLTFRAVGKSLAGARVLHDVSFSCPAGRITALLGPNGAGKTTTVTLAAGLRHPDAGAVRVCGAEPGHATARLRLSLVPQEIGFPDAVSVRRLLAFVERQRPPSAFAPERADLLDRLGIADALDRRIGGLSGGQRRRVALALGLLRAPDVLVLDEATTNLDESARQATWELVADYTARGGAALVTSHILSDIDAHADRVVALNAGRVVAEDALGAIRAQLGGSTVAVRTGDPARLVDAARADGFPGPLPDPATGAVAAGTGRPPTAEGWLRWRTRDPGRLAALVHRVAPGAELTVVPLSLAEILDALTDTPSPPDDPGTHQPSPAPREDASCAPRTAQRPDPAR